jgi:two-component system nitrate/nitrite response regulator NarL
VLRQLMHGYTNKTIARVLDMAEATVKVHVKSILRIMGVDNRTQAALQGKAFLGEDQ